MAGNIENNRKGDWSAQAIGRLNPGQGINFIVSGPVSSSLSVSGSIVDFQADESGPFYIVGLGLRKDSGYTDTLMTCKEVWIPFKDEMENLHRVVLKVDRRTSYPSWIYVWSSECTEDSRVDKTWLPAGFEGEDIYDSYESLGSLHEDLDYETVVKGPGNILFVPYIHPNYLTTDDYNGILGNVMDVSESPNLYSILQGDLKEGDKGKSKLSPNLRYKNHIEDYHKPNTVGSIHAGELTVPEGSVSRCEKQGEYFRSFEARLNEFYYNKASGSTELQIQTLDFPYMSYRAISASVYVDQYGVSGSAGNLVSSPDPVPLKKVWEALQKGNTDDSETIYFTGTAARELKEMSASETASYIKFGARTTIPVSGSILFKMNGHLAVRVTKATIYAPFLNTVYRTGEYGEVKELFTSGSED